MLSKYNIVTLFPKLIEEWLETGIISKANNNNIFELMTTDLRNFGLGDYQQVDDAPYGGGPGMGLRPGPRQQAGREVTPLGDPGGKRRRAEQGVTPKRGAVMV